MAYSHHPMKRSSKVRQGVEDSQHDLASYLMTLVGGLARVPTQDTLQTVAFPTELGEVVKNSVFLYSVSRSEDFPLRKHSNRWHFLPNEQQHLSQK